MRQLENALFRAVVLADGGELTVAEFPQIAAQVEGFDVRRARPRRRSARRAVLREIVRVEVRDPQRHAAARRLRRRAPHGGDGAELIRFALPITAGRCREMARKLGIGRSTLYRKMKDFGLNEGAPGEEAAA